MALVGFNEFCRKWEIGPYGEERVKFYTFNVDYVKDSEGQEFLNICCDQDGYGGTGKIICKNINNKMNIKILDSHFALGSTSWRSSDDLSKRDCDFFDDLGLYACFGCYLNYKEGHVGCTVTPVYGLGDKDNLYGDYGDPYEDINAKTTTFNVAYNKINKFLELMDYDNRKKDKVYIDMVVKCLRESIKSYSWLDDSLLEMSDKEIWEDWNKDRNNKTKKIKDNKFGYLACDTMEVDDKYAEYLWKNEI